MLDEGFGLSKSFRTEPAVIHRTDSYDLWMAFFDDPDGNHLALMCEFAKA